MTPKQKQIFDLTLSFGKKMGCKKMIFSGDYYNYPEGTIFDERSFFCQTGGVNEGNRLKLPFGPAEAFNEFITEKNVPIEEYDHSIGSIDLSLDVEERSGELIANYSVYEGGEVETTEKQGDDVTEAIKKLTEEFDVKEIAYITFTGGGDSGYFDGFHIDGEYESDQVPGYLDDIGYEMLNHYGGWEIDAGSYGRLYFYPKSNTAELEFQWVEEKEEAETQFRFEIDGTV
jgi:hypothetical protein